MGKVETFEVKEYHYKAKPGERVTIRWDHPGKPHDYRISEKGLNGMGLQDFLCEFNCHNGKWGKTFDVPMSTRRHGQDGKVAWEGKTYIVRQKYECEHCGFVKERTVRDTNGD